MGRDCTCNCGNSRWPRYDDDRRNHSTAGWGSIEKKVSDATNRNKVPMISLPHGWVEFISGKAGIKLPMYFGYSEAFINPQYNPLDPECLWIKHSTRCVEQARDSIKAGDWLYTQRKEFELYQCAKNKKQEILKTRILRCGEPEFHHTLYKIYLSA